MAKITFSIICKTFYRYMVDPKKATISKALLSVVTDDPNVTKDNGEPYDVQGKELREFFDGTANIYPNIVNGSKLPSVALAAEDHIIAIFDSLVDFDSHGKVVEELISLVDLDESLSGASKIKIHSMDINDPYPIATQILLHSFSNPNKTNTYRSGSTTDTFEINSVESIIDSITTQLGKLPKPIILSVPAKTTESEMIYVQAILEAFAEDCNIITMTQDDLEKDEYKKYKAQFDRHRKEYYAAESIRESLKDTRYERIKDTFDDLKEDMYVAVIDVVEESSTTSYERMKKVLKHATSVPLDSLLMKIPGWIRGEERKGLCHILVNEERFNWKNE